jgi:predicted phage-related endonuclease
MKGTQWEGDGLPDDYYCQTQHYCAVAGWASCWIAALVGGQRLIYKEVLRNDGFIKEMTARESEFWHDYVLKDIAPAANEADDMSEFYPENATGTLLQPTGKHIGMLGRIFALEAEAKSLENAIESLKNQLRQDIGGASGIDGVATWKNSKPSLKVDWEGVSHELGATPEIIARHSTTRQGARVLRLARKKFNSNKEAA